MAATAALLALLAGVVIAGPRVARHADAQIPGGISGVVTDAVTGDVVADARITLSCPTLGPEVRSGADGAYDAGGVAGGSECSVLVSKRFYYGTTDQVTIPNGGTLSRDYELRPSVGHLEGTVTDSTTGKPVVGAFVSVSCFDTGVDATTDAAGHYRIENRPEGKTCQITLNAGAKYLSIKGQVTIDAGRTVTVDIATRPTKGSIEGHVLEASSGAPLANVRVVLLSGSSNTPETTTAADGSFQFTDVLDSHWREFTYGDPVQPYTLRASRTGYGQTEVTDVLVTGGSTVQVTLRLTAPQGALSGTVTDATTGKAVSGATLSLDGGSNNQTTGSSGRYDFGLVAVGQHTVRATAKAYAASTTTVTVTASGATADLRLTAQAPAGAIYCKVIDAATKQPIDGATVTASPLSGGGAAATTTTTPQGSCAFDHLQPDTIYTVRVIADGYEDEEREIGAVATNTVNQALFALLLDGTDRSLEVILEDAGGQHLVNGGEVWVDQQHQVDRSGVGASFEFLVAPDVPHKVQGAAPGYRGDSTTATVGFHDDRKTVELFLEVIQPQMHFEPVTKRFDEMPRSVVDPARTKVATGEWLRLVNDSNTTIDITSLTLSGKDPESFKIAIIVVGASGTAQTLSGSRVNAQLPARAQALVWVEFWPRADGNYDPMLVNYSDIYNATIVAGGAAHVDSAERPQVKATGAVEVFVTPQWHRLAVLDAQGVVEHDADGVHRTGGTKPVPEFEIADLGTDRARQGYVTDGASMLFLRFQTNGDPEGDVARFVMRLPPETPGNGQIDDWGVLSDLSGSSQAQATPVPTVDLSFVQVKGNLWQATAVILAPERFPSSSPDDGTFTLDVCQWHDGACTGKPLSRRLTVSREPVVLIHGLWASPASFGYFPYGLLPALEKRGYTVAAFQYPNFEGPSVTMRAGSAQRTRLIKMADGLCVDQRTYNHLACQRVDFVAHSMGGLVARALLRDRPEMARRLVTLATPHLGSGFANMMALYNLAEIDDCVINSVWVYDLRALMGLLGKQTGSAMVDLSISSPFLNALNSAKQQVPTYAIIGDTGTDLPTLDLATQATGCTHADLFQGQHSDHVVSVPSARGRLAAQFTTTLTGVPHTGMGTNQRVTDEVLRALEWDLGKFSDSVAAPVPPAPSASTSRAASALDRFAAAVSGLLHAPGAMLSAALSATPAGAAETSALTLTVDNATPRPGDTIVVTAALTGTPADIALLGSDWGVLRDAGGVSPYRWTLELPPGRVGVQTLRAAAVAGGVVVASDPLLVTVLPDQAVAVELQFTPADPLELVSGTTRQLQLAGLLSNDSTIDLTPAATGTTYSVQVPDGGVFRAGQSTVVGVDADGLLHARQPGTALVVAANRGRVTERLITVRASAPDDTDGDGLTDGSEAAIGTSPYEVDTDADGITDAAEVGDDPAKPADRDGDGVADALEPRVVPVATADGQTLTVAVSDGHLVEAFETPAQPGLPNTAASPVVDVRLDGVTPGAAVTVSIFLRDRARDATGFSILRPSTAAASAEWTAEADASVESGQVRFTIADGGPADADLSPGAIEFTGVATASASVSPAPGAAAATPSPAITGAEEIGGEDEGEDEGGGAPLAVLAVAVLALAAAGGGWFIWRRAARA